MAGKPRNRLELRRQHEAAEDLDPIEAETDIADDGDEEVERKPKPKKKAPAKSKAKSTKAVKPSARMRIVWHVVNDAFKTIATFDYTQKAEAEAKAAEMNAKGKGTFFVQKAKEPMAEDAPGLGATITRAAPAATKPAVEADDEAEAVEPPADSDDDEDDEPEEEDDDIDDGGDDD